MQGICIICSRRRGLETESEDNRASPPPYGWDYEQTFAPSKNIYVRGSDCFCLYPSLMLMQPLHGPTPARPPDPQKASGNESLLGASPR